jgi:hypothetical protein
MERSSVAADGSAAALRAAARASDDVPQAALERHLGETLPRRFEQFSKSLIRNWVTKYISTGEAPMAQNGFGGTNRWENGIDDINAGTPDAPGVGALAA